MQDFNKLNKIIKECDENIMNARGEIDKLIAQYNILKSETFEKYNKLRAETSKFFEMINPMMTNLCAIYPQYISFETEHLLYCGNISEGTAVDSESCFEVFNNSIKNIYESTSCLLIKKTGIEENCKNICQCYATLNIILVKINDFIDEKNKKIKADYDAKYARLEKKSQLSKGLKKETETQLQALLKDRQSVNLPFELNLPHSYEKNIKIPLGFSRLEDDAFATYNETLNDISSILEWNLNEEGILLLSAKHSDMALGGFFEAIKILILRFLFCYPATSKRIVFCDNTFDERIISFAGALSESVPSLFLHSAKSVVTENSETDILSTLNEINDIVSRRLVLLGRSGLQNILEYNFYNIDNIQPLIFVLIHGYPKGLGQAAEIIPSLLKNGKKAGVYFVITKQTETTQTDDWTVGRLPEIQSIADLNLQVKIESVNPIFVFDDIDYEYFPLKEQENLQKILPVLQKELSQDLKAIPFVSVIPSENFEDSVRRRAFSKILSVPVGKKGANVLTLEFDSEGDSHVLISGTTGSGKSSLINTLVLSAASLYSPSELEIHMISIIKSEFKIFAEQKLPHLKTLITEDNLVGANDVLDYLVNEMQKRQNLIGSKGDIVNYNISVEDSRKLSRCIIIIDEYQQLVSDDRAREKMNKIAQLGRSCGMCLVLSSQAVPVEFRNSIDLFRHRFEFSATGDLIPDATRRKNELEALKGLCFYGKGNAVELVRIAFPGKDRELTEILKKIVADYPNNKMSLNSDIAPIIVESERNAPFISKNAKRDYLGDGVCKIRLGRKYLSNVPVEFPLSYKNSLLCLCGEYLLTKQIESSIIKDVLYLSDTVGKPTLYYIDFNKNPNWARKSNPVKSMRDDWTMNSEGRFEYFAALQAMNAINELENLVHEREEHIGDENYEIYPVIVMLTCVDQIADDSDECYAITSLMDKGKNNNIFFVMQFNEFSRSFNSICDKIYLIRDAIVVPDRSYDEENYTSAGVINFLLQTEAADSGAKELLKALLKTPLNRNLNIICLNNDVSCFIPYGYTHEYLINLLHKEE